MTKVELQRSLLWGCPVVGGSPLAGTPRSAEWVGMFWVARREYAKYLRLQGHSIADVAARLGVKVSYARCLWYIPKPGTPWWASIMEGEE